MRKNFPAAKTALACIIAAGVLNSCDLLWADPGALPGPTDPPPAAGPLVAGAPDRADRPDGWAGADGAPAAPGGWGAAAANVYTVRTRSAFLTALACGGAAASDLPKIIFVDGLIDLCADAADAPLSAEAFIGRAGLGAKYADYPAYRNAYAASCAAGAAAGLAADRNALYNAQRRVVVVAVGSNTSILGVGGAAGFKNGSLSLSGKTNIVLRNLALLDAYDYFPAWDPAENLFNSEYDNVSVSGSTRVWIDHCRLGDGGRPDSAEPSAAIAGGALKKWVVHDGLVDIVRGADYVTVSWNRVEDHDKTMLIGNSDSAAAEDAGRLRTTVHHNYFLGAKQRLPRVRFGQVHVYNNRYAQVGGYAVGVGDRARIYSEANWFDAGTAAFAKYDDAANEGYFYDVGSNLVAGSEAMASAALVGWRPADAYPYAAESAAAAAASVLAGAGPGGF
jgi:pectate lyase